MTGPSIETCSACAGAQGRLGNPDQGEPPVVVCEPCEGLGRVCCCMQCGEHMLLSEAGREGAYCDGCREGLDVSDRDAFERAHAWGQTG